MRVPGLARASATKSPIEPSFSDSRSRECKDDRRHIRDREEIPVRVVGKLLVLIRMHDEGACRPKQKSMVIVRSGERADGDEPIAAGTIFNDDRLAPARRETIGKQPRRDIGCARGPNGMMKRTVWVG